MIQHATGLGLQDHFHLRDRLFIDGDVFESSFEVTALIAKINIEGVWSVRAKTTYSLLRLFLLAQFSCLQYLLLLSVN